MLTLPRKAAVLIFLRLGLAGVFLVSVLQYYKPGLARGRPRERCCP
jgi:hypothetical protein